MAHWGLLRQKKIKTKNNPYMSDFTIQIITGMG
jgi:hypothetical protein